MARRTRNSSTPEPPARAGSLRREWRRSATRFQPVLGAQCLAGFSIAAAILACLSAAGCNALPAGDSAALQAFNGVSATQPATSPIILIRGWRDLWSDGMDALADKLRAKGNTTAVFKENQWRQVETALAEQSSAGPLPAPVILIGFSYGADDVIRISRRLHGSNQPVDLLVLIDPVTPADIPPNVRRCVNFYQSNGVWDVFPWLRGVAVTAQNPADAGTVENVNLRERPDLRESTTSHKTITGNAKVHAAILREVRETGRRYSLR